MSVCLPTKGLDDYSYRVLLAAACAAVGTLIPVAAHQAGLLDHLPDPPGGIFDSDQITESDAAHPLGIPDGVLGLGSYGITLALALPACNCPTMRRLLALKLLADGSLAGINVARQVISFRKLCSWCTGTAACTGLMLLAGRKLIAEEVFAARRDLQAGYLH